MEQPANILNHRFWIGDILVDSRSNTLVIHGEPIPLEYQVMQVLLCLARHQGEVVSREVLIREVWHERIPNDEGLSQAIWKLRSAMGDSSKDSRFIKTVRKRGYCLKAPVNERGDDTKILLSSGHSPGRINARPMLGGILVLACSVLFLVIPKESPQEIMHTIEERHWVLTGGGDSVRVNLKALSDQQDASIPPGVVDSLVFEALKAYEIQQAIADSLLPDKQVDSLSIRRKLVF